MDVPMKPLTARAWTVEPRRKGEILQEEDEYLSDASPHQRRLVNVMS